VPPLFQFGTLELRKDGVVRVNECRFSVGEAIDLTFDSGYRALRPSGPDEFLVFRRAGSLPMVFSFENGVWKRWVRVFRIGHWRFVFRDLFRSWGIGAPFVLAALGICGWTVVRSLYLLLSARTLWILTTLVVLATVCQGLVHWYREGTPKTHRSIGATGT
jgi:hypothetical protein